MKKQIKTIALALLATMAFTTGFAHENDVKEPQGYEVGMYFDKTSGRIKTFIEKDNGKMLVISFQDEQGNELESTTVGKKESKGMVAFDVNALPSGTYQMKISSGGEESVHVVDIARPQPTQTVTFHK